MTNKQMNTEDWDKGSNQDDGFYELRLYVTGASPNSVRAIANIKVFCEQYLEGRYSLDIIDVYQQVLSAEEEQLVALPMLLKLRPLPERRLIGDMSDTAKVLKGMGIIMA